MFLSRITKKMLVFCGIKFVLNSLCVQLQLKVARGKQNGQSHQCGGRKQKNTKINSKKTKSKLLLLKKLYTNLLTINYMTVLSNSWAVSDIKVVFL